MREEERQPFLKRKANHVSTYPFFCPAKTSERSSFGPSNGSEPEKVQRKDQGLLNQRDQYGKP